MELIGVAIVCFALVVVSLLAASFGSRDFGFEVSEFDEPKLRKVHWRHRRWIEAWLRSNPSKTGVAGIWRFPPYGRFVSVGSATTPALRIAAEGNWWSTKLLKVNHRGRLFVRPSFVEVEPDGEYVVTFSAGGETPLTLRIRLETGQVLIVFNYPRQQWRFGRQMNRHRVFVGIYHQHLHESSQVRMPTLSSPR